MFFLSVSARAVPQTMPTDVRKIAQLALKEQYQFVDCVGEEESTHQHVPQQFTVCGQEQQVTGGGGGIALLLLLSKHEDVIHLRGTGGFWLSRAGLSCPSEWVYGGGHRESWSWFGGD